MHILSCTPENIKAARKKAGLTQTEAATLIGLPSYITWQRWERDIHKMPLDKWTLFLQKTGQLELPTELLALTVQDLYDSLPEEKRSEMAYFLLTSGNNT